MTVYSLEWRQYARSFRQPLRTHHGDWSLREGIILRLEAPNGQIGWGEIAPIPWFGSETLEQAIEFCRSLSGQVTLEQAADIPGERSACQFGLESALESIGVGENHSRRSGLSCCVLLSAEKELKEASCIAPQPPNLAPRVRQDTRGRPPSRSKSPTSGGFRGLQGFKAHPREASATASPKTFKCKIGIHTIDREIDQIDRLLTVLPPGARLRLDANGGLSEIEAHRWLAWCDRHTQIQSPDSPQVEFVEQPLPPDCFRQMQQMSQQFQTPIALDESVATIEQLQDCYERGWQGVFVIKPALAGSPARLREFCRAYQPDVVWSSALETAIGRRYIEHQLIPATGLTRRAIGFGVDQWFADDWGQRQSASIWRSLAGAAL